LPLASAPSAEETRASMPHRKRPWQSDALLDLLIGQAERDVERARAASA